MVHKRQDSQEEDEDVPSAAPLLGSTRLVLAILGFFGFINVYALRVNLSVAIVCMVNQTAMKSLLANESESGNSPSAETCVGSGNGTTEEFQGGEFLWDRSTQGFILGSFFYGYLISQIPSGWIATRFGGKLILGWSMFLAAILTLLTPVLSGVHYAALLFIRIVLGVVGGMSFPAMHAMWGKWAPPLERTKLTSFTYAGAQVGNVITFPLSAFLCKYGFAGGWPSIFYVFGTLSLVWFILWMLLISDSPSTNRFISEKEKKFLTVTLKDSASGENKSVKVPWCKIATSMPVYAIIISNVTSDWGAYTLLTNIPTYMNDVLKFDITSNGLYSALPYILFWAVINFSGWLADFVRQRGILSTTVTRKVFDAFGKIIPALMLVGLGYVDCNSPFIGIVLLILGVSLTGFQYSGFLVNHVDIAPAYAGILFGISNSIASVTGFLSPYVVSVITGSGQSRSQWQFVFYIAAAIYTFGAIFYIIFASGELQDWARQDKQPSGDEDEEQMVKLRSIVKNRADRLSNSGKSERA